MLRAFLIVLFALLVAVAASHRENALRNDPLLFHVHGLSFSADGSALLVPSHTGLAVFRNGAWAEESEPDRDLTGFSVTQTAIYASGHPVTDARRTAYYGLLKSSDGGKTWQTLALAGEADFHVLAASFRSNAIYVLSPFANSRMPAPGLYVTHDEGKTWRRPAAHGLPAELHALAAHPEQAATVAAATDHGVYLSNDGGERFRRLDRGRPVTGIAFSFDGKRLNFAGPLANEIVVVGLEAKQRVVLRLPRLRRDFVTHIAGSPRDEQTLAFATRKRSVYLSTNSGATWRQIAREGAMP